MIILVAAGKEREDRNALGIKRCCIRRQIWIFLQTEAETGGDISFLDQLRPKRRRTRALQRQLVIVQTANHIEIEVGNDIRQRDRRMLGKPGRSNQPDLLPGPRGEDDVARKCSSVRSSLLRQGARDLQY